MMNYSRSMKNLSKKLIFAVIIPLTLVILVCCLIGAGTPSNSADVTKDTTASETDSLNTGDVLMTSATPEVKEPEIISLGEFRLTAYCGCSKCCGKWGENRPLDENGKPIVYTANMSVAKEGATIAADISVLPYGTKVIIDGHEYIVQDRGGSIKENRIDIYFESHQDALNFGVQYKEIFTERMVNHND